MAGGCIAAIVGHVSVTPPPWFIIGTPFDLTLTVGRVNLPPPMGGHSPNDSINCTRMVRLQGVLLNLPPLVATASSGYRSVSLDIHGAMLSLPICMYMCVHVCIGMCMYMCV